MWRERGWQSSGELQKSQSEGYGPKNGRMGGYGLENGKCIGDVEALNV